MRIKPPPTNGFNKNKQNINRRGQPCVSAELKLLRNIGKDELTKKFSYIIKLTPSQAESYLTNPKRTVAEIAMGKAANLWAKTGDFEYAKNYFHYIFGKPTQYIENNDNEITIKWQD